MSNILISKIMEGQAEKHGLGSGSLHRVLIDIFAQTARPPAVSPVYF